MEKSFLSASKNIGVKTYKDARDFALLSLDYFENLKNKKYTVHEATFVEAIFTKIALFSKNLELNTIDNKSIQNNVKEFIDEISKAEESRNTERLIMVFNRLYSSIHNFFDLIKDLEYYKDRDYSTGPFNPDKSNRKEIIHHLDKTIEILGNDSYLTNILKEELIIKINRIISLLEGNEVSWSLFTKETGMLYHHLVAIVQCSVRMAQLNLAPEESPANYLLPEEAKTISFLIRELDKAQEVFHNTSFEVSNSILKDVYKNTSTFELDPIDLKVLQNKIN
jgi:hypothetical protein